MTILEDPPSAVESVMPEEARSPVAEAAPTAPVFDDITTAAPVADSRVLLAAFLGSAGGAWLVGGVFQGILARAVCLFAVAAGTVAVGVAQRSGRAALQYFIVPGSFVVGYLAALLLPNPTGTTGTVPELVRRALSNGGLDQPPIPFDPGWRFLAVGLLTLVAAAAASLALGLGRPRLAVIVPLPLVIAAGSLQPNGREAVGGAVALVLLIAGLGVLATAELADPGAAAGEGGSRGFEVRQLVRGGAALLGVAVALAALSQAKVLFPVPERNRDAKPQKPQVVPLKAVRDRPLFEATSSSKGPWRLGVLDTYDGSAWLLPPFDLDRLTPPETDGAIPGAPPRPSVTAQLTVRDIDGFTLPALPNPQRVTSTKGRIGYDVRTGVLRTTEGAPAAGFDYTVVAAASPTGAELSAAPTERSPELDAYRAAPSPPLEVVDLLGQAPTNPFERLQFLRARLYENVVAAGSGVPVDINPARVVQLLGGADGTPFEIVASEALLARWAGIPARIGYGFNGGTAISPDTVELRPKDGANWLEVQFPGFGWVPILGVPPRAKASLSNEAKNSTPQVRPSDDLTLQVYIPLENPDPLQAFQVVRYWVTRALAVAAGVAALWFVVPFPVKLVRRRRRRRWAAANGPSGRIVTAYAELRDRATDLGVGDPVSTPLDYLERVADDDEHAELAWLVTRGLFGDLVRDLRDEDATAAEDLAASVGRRLASAQGGATRAAALVSRASLREPFDAALANPWPEDRRLPQLRLPHLRLPRRGRPTPGAAS